MTAFPHKTEEFTLSVFFIHLFFRFVRWTGACTKEIVYQVPRRHMASLYTYRNGKIPSVFPASGLRYESDDSTKWDNYLCDRRLPVHILPGRVHHLPNTRKRSEPVSSSWQHDTRRWLSFQARGDHDGGGKLGSSGTGLFECGTLLGIKSQWSCPENLCLLWMT